MIEHSKVVERDDFVDDLNSLLTFSIADCDLEIKTESAIPKVVKEHQEVVSSHGGNGGIENVSSKSNLSNHSDESSKFNVVLVVPVVLGSTDVFGDVSEVPEDSESRFSEELERALENIFNFLKFLYNMLSIFAVSKSSRKLSESISNVLEGLSNVRERSRFDVESSL